MLEIIFEELQHVASQSRGMDRERDRQMDERKTYHGGDADDDDWLCGWVMTCANARFTGATSRKSLIHQVSLRRLRSLSSSDERVPPVQHRRVVAAGPTTAFSREPPSVAQGQPPASSMSGEFKFPSLDLDTEAEVTVDEALRDPDIMVVGLSRYSNRPTPAVEWVLEDAATPRMTWLSTPVLPLTPFPLYKPEISLLPSVAPLGPAPPGPSASFSLPPHRFHGWNIAWRKTALSATTAGYLLTKQPTKRHHLLSTASETGKMLSSRSRNTKHLSNISRLHVSSLMLTECLL